MRRCRPGAWRDRDSSGSLTMVVFSRASRTKFGAFLLVLHGVPGNDQVLSFRPEQREQRRLVAGGSL